MTEPTHDERRHAVTLIYDHLWLCKVPPKASPKGWSLAAELRIWNRLAATYGAERVNGALTIFRRALGLPPYAGMTLLYFAAGDRQHLMKRAIEVFEREEQEKNPVGSIGDLLRQVVAE